MSKSRPIYEDDTLYLTRRVDHRENRLRPDDVVNEAFGYLAAVLSAERNLKFSAVCAMGNHYHALTHDEEAVTPHFTRDFHNFLTRAVNKAYGESGRMWDGRQTSHVRPEDLGDILDRIAYTMANPVAAGLVERIDEYPGVCMAWHDPPRTFKRPDFCNPKAKRPDGTLRWPETATLVMYRPAGFDHWSDETLIAELRRRREVAEKEAHAQVIAKGQTFLGRDGVLETPRTRRATSEEPTWSISPRVAAKNAIRRIARLAFNNLWVDEYDDRLERFRNGDRDVVFPYGTFKMRVCYGVRVAPRPPP